MKKSNSAELNDALGIPLDRQVAAIGDNRKTTRVDVRDQARIRIRRRRRRAFLVNERLGWGAGIDSRPHHVSIRVGGVAARGLVQ